MYFSKPLESIKRSSNLNEVNPKDLVYLMISRYKKMGHGTIPIYLVKLAREDKGSGSRSLGRGGVHSHLATGGEITPIRWYTRSAGERVESDGARNKVEGTRKVKRRSTRSTLSGLVE